MPSGNAPQYETFTPTFPRNSISNHVAGNVASMKTTIKKIRTSEHGTLPLRWIEGHHRHRAGARVRAIPRRTAQTGATVHRTTHRYGHERGQVAELRPGRAARSACRSWRDLRRLGGEDAVHQLDRRPHGSGARRRPGSGTCAVTPRVVIRSRTAVGRTHAAPTWPRPSDAHRRPATGSTSDRVGDMRSLGAAVAAASVDRGPWPDLDRRPAARHRACPVRGATRRSRAWATCAQRRRARPRLGSGPDVEERPTIGSSSVRCEARERALGVPQCVHGSRGVGQLESASSATVSGGAGGGRVPVVAVLGSRGAPMRSSRRSVSRSVIRSSPPARMSGDRGAQATDRRVDRRRRRPRCSRTRRARTAGRRRLPRALHHSGPSPVCSQRSQ